MISPLQKEKGQKKKDVGIDNNFAMHNIECTVRNGAAVLYVYVYWRTELIVDECMRVCVCVCV